MDTTNAVAIVNQYLDIMQVQNNQGNGLENVLTEDFQFDDPFGTASSAREFTSYVQRWIATPKSLHMKHHFVDGDQVCSIYTIDVANASGARASFDIADLFELRGDRIAREKFFFANRWSSPGTWGLRRTTSSSHQGMNGREGHAHVHVHPLAAQGNHAM